LRLYTTTLRLYGKWLKAYIRQPNASRWGNEKCGVRKCALKGQHIVENKYIALSGRMVLWYISVTQGVAVGLSYFFPTRCVGLSYFWLSAKTIPYTLSHSAALAIGAAPRNA